MEKTLKYVLVCFLALLAILLLIFMLFALVKKDWSFSFFNEESRLVLEKEYDVSSFLEIKILSTYSDIHVLNHDDSSVKVLVYSANDRVTSEIHNQILEINKRDRKYGCFGFCNRKEEVYVYLPKDFNKNMALQTVSGDVHLEDFPLSEASIKTTSGDVIVKQASKASIESISGDILITSVLEGALKTVSGDIKVHSLTKSILAHTTSGDVLIDDLTLEESGTIETVSGDVHIGNTSKVYIDAKSTSGSIEVGSQDSSFVRLRVKTISGDILVR